MIQVDNLSLAYSGDPVLENVSFTINRGERCGLVGRNGSGKTTLFRLIIGQEVSDSGTISLSKGYRLGYLDQHIRFSAPTVVEEAALGLKEEERDCIYKAETLLFGLGFSEEQMDAPPAQLSGGYHLRLHLTKVLLSEPDCLLLDEPTNYLDILSLRFLMHFLQEWKGELVLISHDREFMDSISTHTLGIHRKKVRKVEGSSVDFYNQILLQEQIHERTRINQEKQRSHLQSYIDRFGAKASKAAQAQSRKKMLGRIPVLEELKNLYNLNFNFHEYPFHGKKMLDAAHLDFSYVSEKPLIRDFSLAIERGEKVAIIGKNGYGKSTLLRLLTGELIPQQGEVKKSEQAAIGYFGQTNIQKLSPTKTIEEEIAEANPRLNFTQIRSICGQMLFGQDRAKKKISVLSGGEKSRVLLGTILAKPCNLLLLDEPTHHLDIESVEALIDAIEDFQGAVIIVTHSELILKRLALQKLVICHADRQELFLGGYEEFLEKEGWEEEGTSPPKAKAAPPTKQESKDLEKLFKALENEKRKLEQKIEQLQQNQEKEYHLLAEASQKGEVKKIQEHTKKSALIEKELETLQTEWSALETKRKELEDDSSIH